MKRVLVVVLALALVMISAVSLVYFASEPSFNQTFSKQAFSFLEDVVKLDMTNYNARQVESSESPSNLSDSSELAIKYALVSAGSKIDALFSFRDTTLTWCKLYVLEGSPLYAQELYAGNIEAFKGFLERYQAYSNVSYVQDMLGVLNTVNETEAATVISGSVKFDFSFSGDEETVSWVQTVNGIEIGYNKVHVSFRNGFFESFTDSWNQYAVGSAEVNVSEEEAVQVAREFAERHLVEVWPANLTTLYLRDEPAYAVLSMQPRDLERVYPLWQVHFLFDRVFSGFDGIRVSLWADTSEVIDAKVTYGL
jgi:hypothetical protein